MRFPRRRNGAAKQRSVRAAELDLRLIKTAKTNFTVHRQPTTLKLEAVERIAAEST
jgi:hypothetical protein